MGRAARISLISWIGIFVASTIVHAAEPTPSRESLEQAFPDNRFSPYAERNFPNRVLWGDTHLHTSLSMDAGAFGARLVPDDAYLFAKGEQVTSSTGIPARLSRPLDWLVVADHSDNMGLFTLLYEGDPLITKSQIGADLSRKVRRGGQDGVDAALYIIEKFAANALDDELTIRPGTKPYADTWDRIMDSAEKNNDPGKFTAFIGYEWTSLVYRQQHASRGHLQRWERLRPASRTVHHDRALREPGSARSMAVDGRLRG